MSDAIKLTVASEPTLSLGVGSDGVSPSQFADLEKWLRDQWSAVEAEVDTAIDGVEHVDASVTKTGGTATIAVTGRDGTVHTATVTDGKDATITEGSIDWDKFAPDVTNPLDRLMYRLSNMLTATPAEAEVVTVADAAQTPMAGLTVYGKSTQDGTPTPDAPVAIESVTPDSEGNISLLARGKNLLPYPYYDGPTCTQNGITFTVNPDGSLHVQGTATATAYYNFASHLQGRVWTPSTYTISVESPLPTGTSLYFGLRIDGVNKQGSNIRSGTSQGVWTTQDVGLLRGYLTVGDGTTVDTTVYPQIELGSTATAYQPYTYTVTPIDLDGHELRSLPDGTRDELTVDERGHAVLVQRVGHVVLDGSSDEAWRYSSSSNYSDPENGKYCYYSGVQAPGIKTGSVLFVASMASHYRLVTLSDFQTTKEQGTYTFSAYNTYPNFTVMTPYTTLDGMVAWLAENPVTVIYPLATPVTHDLGTVDPVALVGPDLTAQSVPTAPFALTYERDLNTTLARLEAAIAALA